MSCRRSSITSCSAVGNQRWTTAMPCWTAFSRCRASIEGIRFGASSRLDWPRDPEATLRILPSETAERSDAVSADLKNQLAAKVAGFALLVRGHGFAEPLAGYFAGGAGPHP